jgi:hypothetical protein
MSVSMFIAMGIASVIALPAVLLIRRGYRGRKLDDHAICRKCGFDLFGKPAESNKCSECGADLHNPKATRVGNRRHRPFVLAEGIGLLVVAICMIAGGVYQAESNFDWWPHLPFRVVLWLSESKDQAKVSLATAEMLRRYNAGQLDHQQIGLLVDRAMKLQSSNVGMWDESLGDLIEHAYVTRNITPAQWEQYWRNGWRPVLTVTPVIHRGDAFVVNIDAPFSYLTLGSRFVIEWKANSLDLDGIRCDASGIRGDIERVQIGEDQGFTSLPKSIMLPPEAFTKLTDGAHIVHANVEMRATNGNAPTISYSSELSAQIMIAPIGPTLP